MVRQINSHGETNLSVIMSDMESNKKTKELINLIKNYAANKNQSKADFLIEVYKIYRDGEHPTIKEMTDKLHIPRATAYRKHNEHRNK